MNNSMNRPGSQGNRRRTWAACVTLLSATGCAILLAIAQMVSLHPAHAQQIYRGLTKEECAAAGGRITQWTNTAGTFPEVGTCEVTSGGRSGGLTCQRGFTLTRDGKCIPNGSMYCGNGNVCNAGTICADGGCLKITSNRVCSDLKRYCAEGYECRAGNKCISPDAEKAQDHWNDAHRSFEERRFSDAEHEFRKAMYHFMDAKRDELAEKMRKRMAEATCMQRAVRIKDNVAGLKSLAKEKECSDVMAAIMVMALDLQIAEEERAKQSTPVRKTEERLSASPPEPPKPQSGSAAVAESRDKCSDVSGTCVFHKNGTVVSLTDGQQFR